MDNNQMNGMNNTQPPVNGQPMGPAGQPQMFNGQPMGPNGQPQMFNGQPMGPNGISPEAKKKQSIASIVALVGCVIGIIGCFLPYYSAEASAFGFSRSETITYFERDGLVVVGVAVVAIILAALRKTVISLIPSAIGLLISGIDFFNVPDVESAYVDAGFEIGAYVVLFGMITAVVGGILAIAWKAGKK